MAAVAPSRDPARPWVFTWNNYPADAYDLFQANRHLFSVMHIGKEVSSTGTPHLQGMLVCKRATRLSALHRLFPLVHFEKMRGSERQAIEYTEKEGDPDRLDWDDRAQGARTDLHAATSLVTANPRTAISDIARTMPSIFTKYHAGLNALSRAVIPKPALIMPRTVYWFWGPTGTSKSWTALHAALDLAAGDESHIFLWTIQSLKFVGDYRGERFVVFQDLRTTWSDYTFSRLLTLLDSYRCEVEVKGGQVWWNAETIWITAPSPPSSFFTQDEFRSNPYGLDQLLRRITAVREFDVPYAAPACVPAPAPSQPDVVGGSCPATLPLPDICADSDVELSRPPVRSPALSGSVLDRALRVHHSSLQPAARRPVPVPDPDTDDECALVSFL